MVKIGLYGGSTEIIFEMSSMYFFYFDYKRLLFMKKHGPSFKQTWTHFTQRCLCQVSSVEIDPVVLENTSFDENMNSLLKDRQPMDNKRSKKLTWAFSSVQANEETEVK